MERWELIPLKSIGKVEFRMDRDEARRLLGDNYTEFKNQNSARTQQMTMKNFMFSIRRTIK